MRISILFPLLCIPAFVEAGRCEHIRLKAIKCFDILNKFEYFQELAGNELDASGLRGHEELSIVRHGFTGALDEDLFNFTGGKQLLQFVRLQNLTIKNGGLTSVRPNAFAPFCSFLSKLDLSLNRIAAIPLDALQCSGGHSRLAVLNLSGNVIDVLEGLRGLRQLQVLDLSNNSLHLITANGFEQAELLRQLYLQQNYIRLLSEQAFHIFRRRRNTVTLHLADNPLECDCSLRWLVPGKQETLGGISVDGGDQPVCKSPGRLAGQPVRMLSPLDFVCEPVIKKSVVVGTVKRQTSQVEVREGDRIELVCAVFADPMPRVWWTFKDSVTIGKTLDDQMKAGRYSIANVKLDDAGLNVSSTLTIDPLFVSDAGQLRCVAAFHPGAASPASLGQNETSELFQLHVRPRHYRVKPSGLWIVATLMTCSLACLVAFVVYCWLRWSRAPAPAQDKSWNSPSNELVSNGKFVTSPLLDLGPPMYGPPKHEDRHEGVAPHGFLDDFDISAYDEDYRPLVDELRPPGRDSTTEFATTPLLFHHQHPSSSRTVLPNSLGETEL